MIHRSDWLKNFTEMGLDVKPRYLCLSLWAQFCTPSCLFHYSDSAVRTLHTACLALTGLISSKYFGHIGFQTHGRKTLWSLHRWTNPNDTSGGVALIIRPVLISLSSFFHYTFLSLNRNTNQVSEWVGGGVEKALAQLANDLNCST